MARKFLDFADNKRASIDERYMRVAIKEAEKARLDGNLAVGAVLVWSNCVVSDSNTVHSESDSSNHAEMNVFRKACQTIHRPLHDAVLYVTLEPCLMCAMAAHLYGVREVVFGCYDGAHGFMTSNLLVDHTALNIVCRGGVLGNECMELLPQQIREHLRVE